MFRPGCRQRRTMTVQILYFASLRERLGRSTDTLTASPRTVREAWHAATGHAAIPAGLLCAVNQDYADWNAPVRDGDEVAFFPPVTGG